jgi:hypothetical protein
MEDKQYRVFIHPESEAPDDPIYHAGDFDTFEEARTSWAGVISPLNQTLIASVWYRKPDGKYIRARHGYLGKAPEYRSWNEDSKEYPHYGYIDGLPGGEDL